MVLHIRPFRLWAVDAHLLVEAENAAQADEVLREVLDADGETVMVQSVNVTEYKIQEPKS